MRTLGGYSLLDELGRGGMGAVYRARSPKGELVALKLLDRAAAQDPDLLLRFRREAEAGRSLQHPGIARVLDIGQAGGVPYLALELLDGPNLAQALARDGLPSPARAAAWTAAVARAVAHAHDRGVLHRDIKPANVILTARGPVLTDLGLAKLRADMARSLTSSGEILGTPAYMAPEQALAERSAINERTDVYGLGALLFTLLTGEPPFQGNTPIALLHAVVDDPPPRPSERRPEVPDWLDALCVGCLAKSPADRPASAAAVADALEVSAPRRSAAIAAAPALALLAVAVGLGAGLRSATRPSPAPHTVATPTPSTDAASPTPALVEQPEVAELLRQRRFRVALAQLEAHVQAAGPDASPLDVLALARCLIRESPPADHEAYRRALTLAERGRTPGTEDAADLIRAAALLRLRRLEAAGELLEVLVATNPDSIEALVHRADWHAQRGELSASRRILERAVALAPESIDAARALAHVLKRTDDLAGARRELERVLTEADLDPPCMAHLAVVLSELGEFDAARDWVRRAVEQDPDDYRLWGSRAGIEAQAGDSAAALDYTERLLALRPGDRDAQHARVVHLIQLRRYDDARPHLEALQRDAPRNQELIANRGLLELYAGHPAEAVRWLEQVAGSATANQSRVVLALAVALRSCERDEDALTTLTTHLDRITERADRLAAFEQLTELYMDNGRVHDAVRVLRMHVELDATREYVWQELVQGLLFLGRLDAAERALDTYASLLPADSAAEVVLRLYVALHRGDLAEARRWIAALDLPRDGPEASTILAWLALQEGDPEQALVKLAAHAEPGLVGLYVAGLAHRDLGHTQQARDALDRYLQRAAPLEHCLVERARQARAALPD